MGWGTDMGVPLGRGILTLGAPALFHTLSASGLLLGSARGDFLRRSTRTHAESEASVALRYAFSVGTQPRRAVRVARTRTAYGLGAKAFAVYCLNTAAGFGAVAKNRVPGGALSCAPAPAGCRRGN